jgi:hypothetical protein
MIDEQYSESADCEIVRPTPKRLLPPAGLTPRFSCGARSEFNRAETNQLRRTLSRLQLQALVELNPPAGG